MKRLILSGFICFLAFDCFAQNPDIDLLRAINTHRSRALDLFFLFITNRTSVTAYAVPVCIILYSIFKRDRSLSWKASFIFISVLISDGLSLFLKYLINRPRPFSTFDFLEKMAVVSTSSFPSGHTIVAFSMAAAVSLAFKRWFVVLPAFIWAGLVGYSRMALGVHYPSDVAASVVLGYLASYLMYRMGKWLARPYTHITYPVK